MCRFIDVANTVLLEIITVYGLHLNCPAGLYNFTLGLWIVKFKK